MFFYVGFTSDRPLRTSEDRNLPVIPLVPSRFLDSAKSSVFHRDQVRRKRREEHLRRISGSWRLLLVLWDAVETKCPRDRSPHTLGRGIAPRPRVLDSSGPTASAVPFGTARRLGARHASSRASATSEHRRDPRHVVRARWEPRRRRRRQLRHRRRRGGQRPARRGPGGPLARNAHCGAGPPTTADRRGVPATVRQALGANDQRVRRAAHCDPSRAPAGREACRGGGARSGPAGPSRTSAVTV